MNNRNFKLRNELSNFLYETVDDSIVYMKDKQGYKDNDVVKLLLAIKKGKYKYITNDNDYREQVELLNSFFKKEYDCSLISFVLLKRVVNTSEDEVILDFVKDKDNSEHVIYLLEKEDYGELLELIESDKKVFLAFCKIYENSILR
ncbi:MAG: hypothetical protein HFH45_01850 [Bacilli bacterium]|nr:hypothetical protein [Bacilli bacterium]